MWFFNWTENRRSCFFSFDFYLRSVHSHLDEIIHSTGIWPFTPEAPDGLIPGSIWKGTITNCLERVRRFQEILCRWQDDLSVCFHLWRHRSVHPRGWSPRCLVFRSGWFWLHPGHRNTWFVWGSDYGLGTNSICLYVIMLSQTRAAKCRFHWLHHILQTAPEEPN